MSKRVYIIHSHFIVIDKKESLYLKPLFQKKKNIVEQKSEKKRKVGYFILLLQTLMMNVFLAQSAALNPVIDVHI